MDDVSTVKAYEIFKQYDLNMRLLHVKSVVMKNTSLNLRESYANGDISQQEFIQKACFKPNMAKVIADLARSHDYLYEWFCIDTMDMFTKSMLLKKAYSALEDILDTGKPQERLKAAELVLKNEPTNNNQQMVQPQINISMAPAFQKLSDSALLAEYETMKAKGYIDAPKQEEELEL